MLCPRPVLLGLFQMAGVMGSHLPNVLMNSQRSMHGMFACSSLLVARTSLVTQQRFAARRGTRERKGKKKVVVELKKEDFVPHKVKMARMQTHTGPRRFVEKGKPEAIDDVYHRRYFMTKFITLAEAIQFQRETNHPTVLNAPEALVSARIELDMQLNKKNRYLDNFTRILLLPHQFEFAAPKKVIAFCKTVETQDTAQAAGADLIGGLDLIKQIQAGTVLLNNYDHVVAHTSMLSDLLPIRGLMKKRFPNVKQGSMGTDLAQMIERFSKGIEFTTTKDQFEQDFGMVQVPFGKLTMPTEHLEANFASILKDIESCRGRSSGAFITRCIILSPPSKEQLVVDPETYVGKKSSPLPQTSDDKDGGDQSDDEDTARDDDQESEQPRRKASN